MDFLPIFYNLKDQCCLLVGGGDVAHRKAVLLDRAGARLRVVAPDLTPAMEQLIAESGGEYRCKNYSTDDLEGVTLVIAATDNPAVNIHVSEDGRQRGLPVNVVDHPHLSNFIFPTVIDRSPIVVAVSSGGNSPVLARLLRGKIESWIPSAYGQLADLVGRYRDKAKARFGSINERRAFWERVLEGPVAEMVFSGQQDKADDLLNKAFNEAGDVHPGEVYLVGGGPGDPDLLTFRALRLMQQADVVLYDRLVSPAVLDLCRRDADKIHVGKENRNHSMPQDDINTLLVRLAQQGKRVLRLKGGDPFIFGRGGEEIEQLAELGIPFQVVPGITAASGCASYAGIPLTHRDYAQSVRFVTGHLKNDSFDLPWNELIHPNQTLVIYMGLAGLPKICEGLISHGMPADTPIALVERGTLPDQRVFCATVATILECIKDENVHAPTLTIVGDVVKLRDRLSWRD